MYKNFAYISSLNPQSQLREVDYTFTFFLNTTQHVLRSYVFCLRSSIIGAPRVRLKGWLKNQVQHCLPLCHEHPKVSKHRKSECICLWPECEFLEGRDCAYSCFIANTWHCMNFNKAQCLLSPFECLFSQVDCSWEQKLCLIRLSIPPPSTFVDPNRVDFSARRNILWIRKWTFCQMGLS